jgi:hypothetical protein
MTLGRGIENEWAQVQKGQTHSVVQPAGEPKKGPRAATFYQRSRPGSLGLIGGSMTRGRPLGPVTIQSGLVSTLW